MLVLRSVRFIRRNVPTEWMGSKKMSDSALVPLAESADKKIAIFLNEQKKQLDSVGRVEKITVQVVGAPDNVELSMNKNVSTPYDCCKHISKIFAQQTPLAIVNEKELWDMHRPLPDNCTVRFLQFKDPDPFYLNQVFWRTGSFALGAVISKAFRDGINILLHSFPHPVVKSGSFVYDAGMNIADWSPTLDELKVLSSEFLKYVAQNHKIERLSVKKSVAVELFEGNPIKQDAASSIAANSPDNLVTVYRMGDHFDISKGPMLSDTYFFGRCFVSAVFCLQTPKRNFYRFQGVALPKGIMLNTFAFKILETRASRLNEAPIPGIPEKFNYYAALSVLPNSKTDIQRGTIFDS